MKRTFESSSFSYCQKAAYLGGLLFKTQKFWLAGRILCVCGVVLHLLATLLRWYASHQVGMGHAPLTNNFVRWNVRHKEVKYLTGGKEVGDKVYFAQCVEGVWYKVKAVITEKQMDDNLFNLTVKSTTGLGVITFRAEKPTRGSPA